MADLLRFRKGTYAQINAATKVPGTIYIAKDEKAMYVDVSADERIRIGDFIRVEKVEGITPPYSTTALYYVEADNALLKYDGSAWKQVNGTDDLKASLTALTERVTAAEGKITTAEGKITALETKVGAAAEGENDATGLFAAVADNAADIADLKAAVGGVGDDSLGNRMTAVEGRMTTAEGEIDVLQEAVAGHTTTLGQHTTAIADNAKAISDHEAYATETYATKTALSGEVTAREQAIAKEVEDRNAAIKVEADRAAGAEVALGARVKVLEDAGYQNADQVGSAIYTKIAAARALITTEIDEDVAALKAEVVKDYATKSELEAVDAKAIKNAADIVTINNNITNNIATKTELATGVSEAKTYADDVAATAKAEAIADAATKYATTGDLATANEAITAAAASAKKANDDLATYKTEAGNTFATKTELGEEATARDNAVKAEAQARGAAISALETAYKAADETLTQAAAAAKAQADKGVEDAGKAQAAADKAQGDATQALADAAAAQGTANSAVSAAAAAQSAADAAQDTADANGEAITGLTGRVKNLEDNSATKAELASAKSELEQKIANDINAANAMNYMGGVKAESDLPTEKVKAGYTYVAESAFTASFGDVLPGDLIIATGDEVNGYITEGLTWTLVNTGYDATLEQTIKTVDGKIQLTSAVGNANNGAISFVAEEGSAIKVAVADNTVTVGMVWEDFTE